MLNKLFWIIILLYILLKDTNINTTNSKLYFDFNFEL